MNRELTEALRYIMERSRYYLHLCRVLFRKGFVLNLNTPNMEPKVKERVTSSFEAIL